MTRVLRGFVCLCVVSFVIVGWASLLVASDAAEPLDRANRPHIAQNSAAYPRNIWVTDALAKVHTDDPPGTQHVAKLSAARNEWESFQVHV